MLVAALAVGGLTGIESGAEGAPAAKAKKVWSPRPLPAEKSVAMVAKTGNPKARPVPPPSAKPTVPVWPAAASVDVALTAPAARTMTIAGVDAGGAKPVAAITVPGTNILIAPDTTTGGTAAPALPSAGSTTPAKVTVTVVDRTISAKAGIPGEIVTVKRADGGSGPVHVNLGVDYTGFKDAFGGSFGARLNLVELPACVLTTPQLPACQKQTKIKYANTVASKQLSAAVTVPGGKTAGATTSAQDAAAAPAGGGILVVATDSTQQSPSGAYSATALKASDTWTVDSSGSFGYSYPVAAPPTLGGAAPALDVSYSSSAMDGKTPQANPQGSVIGDGWGTGAGGFIEKSFTPCVKSQTASAAQIQAWKTAGIGDMCLGIPNATLSMPGHAGALIHDDTDPNLWRLQGDDGTRVELLTGSSNGDAADNGTYWRLTTPDGTEYYFGADKLPTAEGGTGTDSPTYSAWAEPVFGPGTPANCADPLSGTADPKLCRAGYRWNLDFVIDPHRNITRYDYLREYNYYKHVADGTHSSLVGYTSGGYLRKVEYGMQAGDVVAGKPAAAEVAYTLAPRCLAGIGPATCPTSATENFPSAGLVATGLNPDPVSGNAAVFMDVPSDQVCASTGSCNNFGPSFFETARLTGISTGVRVSGQNPPADTFGLDAGYVKVDTYSFNQGFYSPDAGTTLEVNSVFRSGWTGGIATPTPSVAFSYSSMPNRASISPVFGSYGGDEVYRLTAVSDELGGDIQVGYNTPGQAPYNCPTVPAVDNNTTLCYPEYWTKPGDNTPSLDWFNKYVVTSVQRGDNTTLFGASASTGAIRTDYQYFQPAWHSNDSEQVPAANRTFDQFHGFRNVQTIVGGQTDATKNTLTDTRYMQGMDQDPNLAGVVAPVTVPDYHGGSYTDDIAYAGHVLETVTYDNDGTNKTALLDVVNVPMPTGSGATATHTPADTKLAKQRARFTHTLSTTTYRPWSDGTTHSSKVSYGYNDTLPSFTAPYHGGGNGRLEWTFDAADPAPGDPTSGVPATCTVTQYANGGTLASAAAAQRSAYPAQATVYAAGTSCSPGQTGIAIGQTQTFYNGQPLSSMTDPGDQTANGPVANGTASTNVTTVKVAKSFDASGNAVFATKATSPASVGTGAGTGFDPYGRALQAGNADGSTTRTDYVPAWTAGGNYLPTQTVAHAPNKTDGTPTGFTTSTTIDPGRTLPTAVADANGQVTTISYDGLGRTAAVWLPGHSQQTYGSTPNKRYTYTLPAQTGSKAPAWVKSETLGDDASNPYSVGIQIFDGLGRVVQTQSTPVNDANGQVVTDTDYDYLGRVHIKDSPYWDGAHNPSGTWYLFTDNTTFQQTRTDYDLVAHSTTTTALASTQTMWTGSTRAVAADRADVTPPTGGIATTSFMDIRGRTTQLLQWKNSPSAVVADTTQADATHYTYKVNSDGTTKSTVTDAAGNTWASTTDVLGRKTATTDPNAGTSSAQFDDAGLPLQSTDADNNTLTYSYDLMGRRTGVSHAGVQLDSWTYDATPLADPAHPGALALNQVSSSTRYDQGPTSSTGAAYVSTVKQYDQSYRPLTASIQIPSTGPDAGLAGTYTSTNRYTAISGLLHQTDLPAVPKANFAADTITYSYNSNDLLMTAGSNTADYLVGTTYDPLGDVTSRTLGDYPYQVVQQTLYDPPTRRVTKSFIDTSAGADPNNPLNLLSSGVDYTTYTYNAAGRITSTSDFQGAGTGNVSTDLQCYRYDPVGRLKDAWTDNGGTIPPAGTTNTGFGTGPAPGGIGTCKNASPTAGAVASGPAPYWQTFTAPSASDPTGLEATDPLGNRGTVVDHGTGGTADTTRTFTTHTTSGGPHQLDKVATSGATSGIDTYGYDAAGNTTTRTISAKTGQSAANQTLTWDWEGHLAQVTDTSGAKAQYLYAADGSQLIRRDTGGTSPGTTLYLGGTEIRLNGTTTTAQRYFGFSGAPTTIVSSTGGVSIEPSDGHGTGGATIDATPGATTQGKVTARRYTKPFGDARGIGLGTTFGAFPDDHTFLGKTTDTNTALVDIGARKYDTVTGRFISVDPAFDPSHPQGLGGYAYAGNDPVNNSDPSGLFCDGCDPNGVWGSNPGTIDSPGWSPPAPPPPPVVIAPPNVTKCANSICINTHKIPTLDEMKGMGLPGAWTKPYSQLVGDYINDLCNSTGAGDASVQPICTWGVKSGVISPGVDILGIQDNYDCVHGDGHCTAAIVNDVLWLVPWGKVGKLAGKAAGETLSKGADVLRAGESVLAKQAADTLDFLARAAQGDSDALKALTCNSFTGDTAVLMSDGTTKPIKDVEVGDAVTGTDSDTWGTGPHKVTALIRHHSLHTMVDVTIAGGAVIHATDHHPFWDATTGKFTDAVDLKVGDRLRQPDGATVTITSVRVHQETVTAYNLTIDGVHTYYVVAGDTPVLVHNVNCPFGVDDLRKAATDPLNGKAGDSPASRAYQKHMGRPGTTLIDLSSGKDRIDVANSLVDDLLTNPKSAVQEYTNPEGRNVIQYHLPDIGASWDADTGTFIGFLDH